MPTDGLVSRSRSQLFILFSWFSLAPFLASASDLIGVHWQKMILIFQERIISVSREQCASNLPFMKGKGKKLLQVVLRFLDFVLINLQWKESNKRKSCSQDFFYIIFLFISEFRSDTQELTSHSNSKPGNSAQAYDNQNEDILASELDLNTIKSKVRKKVVLQISYMFLWRKFRT